MAHFYGTLKGNRGEATRMGTKDSGITTNTASWKGAVRVELWYDQEKDEDMCNISFVKWHGAGSRKLIYHGPVSGVEFPDDTAHT